MDYDLESSPLELKTNSASGSGQLVHLQLVTIRDEWVGKVRITFGSTPEYQLVFCTKGWSNFQTVPPPATDKIWRITVTRSPDIRVKIHCNGVEVLNIVISDVTCGGSEWIEHWTWDIEKIKFHATDTASKYYKPYTGTLLIAIMCT